MSSLHSTSSSIRPTRWNWLAAVLVGVLLAVAAPPAAHAVPGSGLHQNGSSAIVPTGTWTTSTSIQDSGGSVAFATRTARASLTFSGTKVSWISRTSSSSGINAVSIDGVRVATVDRYTADTRYQQTVYTSPTLTSGTHTIEVAYTNTKNPLSTSANLIVDAFMVGDPVVPTTPLAGVGVYESAPSIAYVGSWSRMVSGSDSGGSSEYLNSAGYALIDFTGDTVEWVSRLTPSAGIAIVYIDGVKVAEVDRYSATTLYQQTVFRRTGLASGKHTIKIEWSGRANPASPTKNLLIDSIVVPDTIAPVAPAASRSSSAGGDVVLAWDAVSDPGLAGYRVYGRIGSGTVKLIGKTSAGSTFFRSLGVPSNSSVAYTVTAIDAWGNESRPSPSTVMQTGITPSGSHRHANCPVADVTVTTPAELKSATAAARPGNVIRLAPGVWPGQLDITARGAADAPIWICGSRDVIIDGGGYTVSSPINVAFSSHLVVTGMTATNALKGVTVRASDHITISDMLVHDIGYEGIHLRSNTTDSTVVGNVIRSTGRLDPFYGEGIYIGSSKNNWCLLTDCSPDRSDRIAVLYNTISGTGSDLIEAKEGTTGGLIAGNILDGTGGMSRTESWMMISGNDWTVTTNSGLQSSLHGFRLNGDTPGWGLRNLFTQNTGRVDAAGFGFKVWERSGPGTTETLITCDNAITGAASGFSNVACTD